ncbi:MAG: CoA ester lyase [Pseudomonadota bacterium]
MSFPVIRSLLFASANRASVYQKVLSSHSDAVCLDLEDAVPRDQKAEARAPALAWMTAGGDIPWRGLRINSLRTPEGLADMVAVCAAAPQSGFLMLPKVDAAADVQIVAEALDSVQSGLRLGALIESAAGLEQVYSIADASPRLAFLVFGAVDLSAELGIDGSDASLAYARGRVVHAARAADRPILDVPALAYKDVASVAEAATRAKALGFSGKAAIHPSNIACINAAFTPAAEEIDEAREIVDAFEAAPNGLVVRNGTLIEKPVIRAMQARLALAEAAGIL